MPQIQIPLMRGTGRSSKDADYVDRLPVNILPTLRQVDDVAGYLRFFPGIEKSHDVNGVSRGVHWNTVKQDCYRVAGGKLYLGENEVGEVAGSGRVSMAHGRTSQAVAANGKLYMHRYDGEVKTLSNWPDSETFPGFTKTIASGIHNKVEDKLNLTAETVTGKLTLSLYPTTTSGKTNGVMTVTEDQWATPQSQSKPAVGIPYVKNLRITGIKFAGSSIYVEYDFYANDGDVSNPWQAGTSSVSQSKSLKTLWGKADPQLEEAIEVLAMVQEYDDNPSTTNEIKLNVEWEKLNPANSSAAQIMSLINNNRGPDNDLDASRLVWVQKVDDTIVPQPQYDWGQVGDVCRLRGRYIWTQKGTDTFWLSSLEDESKPDKIAPAYRAENMPDGILAVREWRDYLVCFGSSTIEFFRLTGDANNLMQFQPGYMVPVGIAGQFAITNYMETFAYITSAARGQVRIESMGQGVSNILSDHHVNKILAGYSANELESAVLEQLQYDANMLLICHLPRETLVYNAVGQVWSIIKTGLYDGPHRAIDYCNSGNQITCGDKLSGFVGVLSQSTSAQYGDNQEIILDSPFINAMGAVVSDLEITSSSGVGSVATRLLMSATEDGINYGKEIPVIADRPDVWLNRSIRRRIGRVRSKISFRFRIVGATPVTLTNLRARVD